MIIDFHTHAFPDALAPKAIGHLLNLSDSMFRTHTDATIGGLVAYMDECGIDISVLQPIVTKQSQTKGLNEWAAESASDRIIPFGSIFPQDENFKEAIDFVVSLGIKGIKLHPEYQDFNLDDPSMLRIYDYALSQGLIILFHAGFDPAFKPPFKTSPLQFSNVLDAMKGGTIVAAHLGGHEQWEDVIRYLAGREIYLDTSMCLQFISPEMFIKVLNAHGADKLLFATDSPWSDATVDINLLKTLDISDSDRELIFNGNAKRLLNLA